MDGVWATKSEGVGLIDREISFQDFQPMWSWSTNVTDGRTDGRTTCDRNTALCTKVHRAVKTVQFIKLCKGDIWICRRPKTAKIWKLCYKLPSVVTFTFIQTFDQIFYSLLNSATFTGRVTFYFQYTRYFRCPVGKTKSCIGKQRRVNWPFNGHQIL